MTKSESESGLDRQGSLEPILHTLWEQLNVVMANDHQLPSIVQPLTDAEVLWLKTHTVDDISPPQPVQQGKQPGVLEQIVSNILIGLLTEASVNVVRDLFDNQPMGLEANNDLPLEERSQEIEDSPEARSQGSFSQPKQTISDDAAFGVWLEKAASEKFPDEKDVASDGSSLHFDEPLRRSGFSNSGKEAVGRVKSQVEVQILADFNEALKAKLSNHIITHAEKTTVAVERLAQEKAAAAAKESGKSISKKALRKIGKDAGIAHKASAITVAQKIGSRLDGSLKTFNLITDPVGFASEEFLRKGIVSLGQAVKPYLPIVSSKIIGAAGSAAAGIVGLLLSDDIGPERVSSPDPMVLQWQLLLLNAAQSQQEYQEGALSSQRRRLQASEGSFVTSAASRPVPLFHPQHFMRWITHVTAAFFMNSVQVEAEPVTALLMVAATAATEVIVKQLVGALLDEIFGLSKKSAPSHNPSQQNLYLFLEALSKDFALKVEDIMRQHFMQFRFDEITKGITASTQFLLKFANSQSKDFNYLNDAEHQVIAEVYSNWTPVLYAKLQAEKDPAVLLAGLDLLIAVAHMDLLVHLIALQKNPGLGGTIKAHAATYKAHAQYIMNKLLGLYADRVSVSKSYHKDFCFPDVVVSRGIRALVDNIVIPQAGSISKPGVVLKKGQTDMLCGYKTDVAGYLVDIAMERPVINGAPTRVLGEPHFLALSYRLSECALSLKSGMETLNPQTKPKYDQRTGQVTPQAHHYYHDTYALSKAGVYFENAIIMISAHPAKGVCSQDTIDSVWRAITKSLQSYNQKETALLLELEADFKQRNAGLIAALRNTVKQEYTDAYFVRINAALKTWNDILAKSDELVAETRSAISLAENEGKHFNAFRRKELSIETGSNGLAEEEVFFDAAEELLPVLAEEDFYDARETPQLPTVSHETMNFAASTADSAWVCRPGQGGRLICENRDNESVRVIDKTTRAPWSAIAEDQYECEMLDISGEPVKYCDGRFTEFMEYLHASPKPELTSVLTNAAVNGFMMGALPEAIGDVLFHQKIVTATNAERIKLMTNAAIILATGSYLATGASIFTTGVLKRLGVSDGNSRLVGSTVAFFVSTGMQCTPTAIAATIVNHGGARVGFWVEKQAVASLCKEPPTLSKSFLV